MTTSRLMTMKYQFNIPLIIDKIALVIDKKALRKQNPLTFPQTDQSIRH